jgi:hypothetical protein
MLLKGDEGGAKFVAENGDFRQGGQDALYPALSGEWEVPVTRNAKITPVNEGGWGTGSGGLPSGITFGRVPRYP